MTKIGTSKIMYKKKNSCYLSKHLKLYIKQVNISKALYITENIFRVAIALRYYIFKQKLIKESQIKEKFIEIMDTKMDIIDFAYVNNLRL